MPASSALLFLAVRSAALICLAQGVAIASQTLWMFVVAPSLFRGGIMYLGEGCALLLLAGLLWRKAPSVATWARRWQGDESLRVAATLPFALFVPSLWVVLNESGKMVNLVLLSATGRINAPDVWRPSTPTWGQIIVYVMALIALIAVLRPVPKGRVGRFMAYPRSEPPDDLGPGP